MLRERKTVAWFASTMLGLTIWASAAIAQYHHHGPGPRPPAPPAQPPAAIQQQLQQQQMMKSVERTKSIDAEEISELDLDNRIGGWNDFINLSDEEIIALFQTMGLINEKLTYVTPEEMYGLLFDGGRDRIEARDEAWYGSLYSKHDDYASAKGREIAEAVAERHNQTVGEMVEVFRKRYADGCSIKCTAESFAWAMKGTMQALNNGITESQSVVINLVYQSGNDAYKAGSWVGDAYTEFLHDFANTESGKSITDYNIGRYYGGSTASREEDAVSFADRLVGDGTAQIASLQPQTSGDEEDKAGNLLPENDAIGPNETPSLSTDDTNSVNDPDTPTAESANVDVDTGGEESRGERVPDDQISADAEPLPDSPAGEASADGPIADVSEIENPAAGGETGVEGQENVAAVTDHAHEASGETEGASDRKPAEELPQVERVFAEVSAETDEGGHTHGTGENFVTTPPAPLPQVAPVYSMDNLPPDCGIGDHKCSAERNRILDDLLDQKIAELKDLTDRYQDKVNDGYRDTLEMKQTLTELESIPDRSENEFWNTWWMSGFIDYGSDAVGVVKTAIVVGACTTATALCATAAAVDAASGKAEAIGAGIGEFSADMIYGSGDLLTATGKGGTALLEKHVGNRIAGEIGNAAGSALGSTAVSGRLPELAERATENFGKFARDYGDEAAERFAAHIYRGTATEAAANSGRAINAVASLATQSVDAKLGVSGAYIGGLKTLADDATSDSSRYTHLVSREAQP